MTKIIKDKNFDEIEKLFSYYTLVSEMRTINSYPKQSENNKKLQDRKQEIQERIKVFEHDLSRDDMTSIQNIA